MDYNWKKSIVEELRAQLDKMANSKELPHHSYIEGAARLIVTKAKELTDNK